MEMHKGMKPKKPKEGWTAQGICSCCRSSIVGLMPAGQMMVRCKKLKLADLDFENGTCPHQDVVDLPYTIQQVFDMMSKIGHKPITEKEVRQWGNHPLDCPCIPCLRVRFFLMNYDEHKKHDGGVPT